MKTVMLYGFLGKKFGKVHRLNVKTVSKAVQLLIANFPTFKKEVIDGGSYKVIVGKERLGKENLDDPVGNNTIRIIPVIQGSGENPVGRIIVGVFLIWASIYTGGAAAAAAASGSAAGGAGIAFSSAISSFGTALILGGIYQLLFPAPGIENTDRPDRKASFLFNGAVNTVAQGNPVPVCYGQLLVGSQVVSAGLSTQDIPV